jgi:hypothetical protein
MTSSRINAEPYDFDFDPKTTALLIIDMQRDFVEPGGFGEALGNDVSILRKTIAPTKQVLEACRKIGMMIVHTREGHRQVLTLSETHVFASNLVNEVRLGANRIHITFTPNNITDPSSLGLAGLLGANQQLMPTISIGDIGALFGDERNFPQGRGDATFVLADTVSWVRGRHSFKFGTEARDFRNNNFNNDPGQLIFNCSLNLITATCPGGTPQAANVFASGFVNSAARTLGNVANRINEGALDFFAQDSWKVKPNFTLEAGVRWDISGGIGEKDNLGANFLPNDRIEHSDRAYFQFTDVTDLRRGLRFDTDIATVSDSNYFSDFAVGSEQTSVTYLERRADVRYYDDIWRIRGELQNFQTIDTAVLAGDRPYSRVPRIQAEGLWPVPNSHFELALDGEATNFLRGVGPTGVRLNLSPEVRWSNRGSGYFFEPAVGYHFTQYDLQNATGGNPSTPSRTLPYARLDAGLLFERDAGSAGQRTQTLEPRLVYSYVPYRNQNELPNFDTALPDLNLTELFRTNRYVGEDRIGEGLTLTANRLNGMRPVFIVRVK